MRSGLLLAFTVAITASFVSDHYGGPVMLYALLIGMAFNFLAKHEQCQAGIEFSTTHVLRLGVALLGVRISFADLQVLGFASVALVIGILVVTILAGSLIGRLCRLDLPKSLLSAGAVAVCGASAALAIASVLPKGEGNARHTIVTVVTVTALSTFAMVFYPVLAGMFDFDDIQAGIFLGASIHDVAQVVGAGYSFSDPAGETSTIIKLIRVACLAPLVLVISLVFRSSDGGSRVGIPPFLLAFCALIVINSLGLIPEALGNALAQGSRWLLVIAVAALGVKTSLAEVTEVGRWPFIAMTLQTALLAAIALAVIFLLGPRV